MLKRTAGLALYALGACAPAGAELETAFGGDDEPMELYPPIGAPHERIEELNALLAMTPDDRQVSAVVMRQRYAATLIQNLSSQGRSVNMDAYCTDTGELCSPNECQSRPCAEVIEAGWVHFPGEGTAYNGILFAPARQVVFTPDGLEIFDLEGGGGEIVTADLLGSRLAVWDSGDVVYYDDEFDGATIFQLPATGAADTSRLGFHGADIAAVTGGVPYSLCWVDGPRRMEVCWRDTELAFVELAQGTDDRFAARGVEGTVYYGSTDDFRPLPGTGPEGVNARAIAWSDDGSLLFVGYGGGVNTYSADGKLVREILFAAAPELAEERDGVPPIAAPSQAEVTALADLPVLGGLVVGVFDPGALLQNEHAARLLLMPH